MPISESLPPEEPQPEDRLAAARRRRAHRLAAESSERGEFLADLVHQGTATLDFFLFALLAGIVLGAAILLDAPALFLLAALLAPFMAPVVGMALGTAAGSLRLFVRSLVSLVIGGLIVAGIGALAGAIGSGRAGPPLQQAAVHAQFNLPDVVVLALGAVVTVYLVVRNPRVRPAVSSVALAYELLPALGAAGFGLVSNLAGQAGVGFLWPDGLVVFTAYLALAVVVGALVFILMGIHPSGALGFLVMLLLIALMAGAAFVLIFPTAGDGPQLPVSQAETATTEPGPPDSPTPSATWTLVRTSTPGPPTSTPAPTNTVAPTSTPTRTLLPSATPVWGLVKAGDANGVIIRSEPNSLEVVTTLLNGNLIQILPEQVNKAGVIWVHVRTTAGLEGWVQAALIATATPRP